MVFDLPKYGRPTVSALFNKEKKMKHMNRRDFLKVSALATAGTVLVSCAPKATVVPTAEVKATEKPGEKPADTPVPEPTMKPPETKAPVTIKWWDFPRGWAPGGSAENPNAWNEDLVKQYQEANPEVTVEFTPVSWGDGPQKLDVSLTAGENPNLMYGYPALFGKMASLDVLMELDDYLATMDPTDVADFFQAGWDFVTAKGKKVAFPWYYGTEGEYGINTSIVEEAGATDLLPKGPDFAWTPEQFLELAKKCTFKRGADQVWGTVVYCSDPQGINLWPFWSIPYMFGASLYNEQEAKSDFGGAAGVKAFQFLYDLVNADKVAPPGAAGLTGENLNELWNRKQSVIRVSSGVEIMNGLKAALEAGTIEAPFEVLPVLPPVAAGQKQKVSGAVGVIMPFAEQDQAKADATFKFTEWLTNAENMMVFKSLSNLCARKSTTVKMAGDDPLTKWRIDYVLPNMASYSKHPQDIKIDDAWMQALQAMYDDAKTPADAAMWFQDEANKLLQEG
jgi:ABC-type glycerol-3-phosphate transport system substrate-binding protein